MHKSTEDSLLNPKVLLTELQEFCQFYFINVSPPTTHTPLFFFKILEDFKSF